MIAAVAGIMVAGALAVVLPSVAFAQTATGGSGGIGGAGGAGGVGGNGGNNAAAGSNHFGQSANGGDANGGHGGNANGGDAAACHNRCGARA